MKNSSLPLIINFLFFLFGQIAIAQETIDFSTKYKELNLPFETNVFESDFQRSMRTELEYLYGEEEMLLEGKSLDEVQRVLEENYGDIINEMYSTLAIGKIKQGPYTIYVSHVRDSDPIGGLLINRSIKLSLFNGDQFLDEIEVAFWQSGNVFQLEEFDFIDCKLWWKEGGIEAKVREWTTDENYETINENKYVIFIQGGKFEKMN